MRQVTGAWQSTMGVSVFRRSHRMCHHGEPVITRDQEVTKAFSMHESNHDVVTECNY